MADAVSRWRVGTRSGNPLTLFSTDLNSLANNGAVLSAAVSNDAADELDLYVDLELAITFGTSPTENSLIEVYVVRQIDGTNYETNSSEGRPKNGFVGGFVLDNVTTAQRLILPGVLLPPNDFKLLVINKSGQAFPASGTVIKGLFYTTFADE